MNTVLRIIEDQGSLKRVHVTATEATATELVVSLDNKLSALDTFSLSMTARRSSKFSAWEISFIRGLYAQLEASGRSNKEFSLSAKQRVIAERLINK